MNKYRICELTCLSTFVRLMGAALRFISKHQLVVVFEAKNTHVALRINLVS